MTVVAPEHTPHTFYPLHSGPGELDIVRLPGQPAPFVLGIQRARTRGVAWDELLASLQGENAIIHGQDVHSAGEIATQIGRRCRLPVMLHAHYPLLDSDPADWLTFSPGMRGRRAVNAAISGILARRARATCRRANLIAAVSPYVQEMLAKCGISNTVVLPCGVDLPADLPAVDIRRRHGIPQDSPIFLYTGRMDPDKRIGDLLEVAAILRQREPRARLLLVGGGHYLERYIRRAEALRLGDTVVFAGWASYQDIWAYYAQADLFLLANAHEALGLVTLEAQAMGLPVVGYRGGGLALSVADGTTGLLTDPTPQALAEAALALHWNPERRKAMSAAARAHAARYSSEQLFPSLLEAYARLSRGAA